MDKTSTRFASIWDALADTAEEAANLKVRAEMMRKIASLIQESGWTQAAAAERVQAATHQQAATRPHLALLARCAGQRGGRPWPASACRTAGSVVQPTSLE